MLKVLAASLASISVVTAYPSFSLRIPNGRKVKKSQVLIDAGIAEWHKNRVEGVEYVYTLGHQRGMQGAARNTFGQHFTDQNYTWTRELCMMDSDGDGYTNGEELGDPCCVFDMYDLVSEYTENFQPTHPDIADDHPSEHFDTSNCGLPQMLPKAEGAPLGEPNCDDEGNCEEVGRMEFSIANYELPTTRTHYVDFVWNVPQELCLDNGDGRRVLPVFRSDVIFTNWTVAKYIHHFVVSGCSSEWQDIGFGGISYGEALDRNVLNKEVSCTGTDSVNVKGGWAPGSPIIAVDGSTVDLWDCDQIKSIRVNTHFDNFDNLPGLFTNDGFFYDYVKNWDPANTLRQDQLRSLFVQKISLNPYMSVPAHMERYFFMRKCTVEVQGNPPGFELPLMTAFGHGHLLATEMAIEKIDGETGEVTNVWIEPVWHFEDQYRAPITLNNITLKHGDTLIGACGYNSESRNYDTIFGTETVEEMCWTSVQWKAQPGDPVVKCVSEDNPLIPSMRDLVLDDDTPLQDIWQYEIDGGDKLYHVGDYGTAQWSPNLRQEAVGTCSGKDGEKQELDRLDWELCTSAKECYTTCCKDDGSLEEDCMQSARCLYPDIVGICDPCYEDVAEQKCLLKDQPGAPTYTQPFAFPGDKTTQDFIAGIQALCPVIGTDLFSGILLNAAKAFGNLGAFNQNTLKALCPGDYPNEITVLNKHVCKTHMTSIGEILDLMKHAVSAEDSHVMDCMLHAACPLGEPELFVDDRPPVDCTNAARDAMGAAQGGGFVSDAADSSGGSGGMVDDDLGTGSGSNSAVLPIALSLFAPMLFLLLR